jgi:hypothetical protein
VLSLTDDETLGAIEASAASRSVEPDSSRFDDLKAFTQTSVGPTMRMACLNLMLGSGLGSMTPDTVVIPLRSRALTIVRSEKNRAGGEEEPYLPVESQQEYMGVLKDALTLKKNVLLAANFTTQAPSGAGGIDMWIFGDVPSPEVAHSDVEIETSLEATPISLMLQLGHISYSKNYRKGGEPRLRLCQMVPPGQESCRREARLEEWIAWARLPCAEVAVFETPQAVAPKECGQWSWLGNNEAVSSINKTVREQSGAAATVFMLAPMPGDTQGNGFVGRLAELVAGLPPTVLARNGQGAPVITSVI